MAFKRRLKFDKRIKHKRKMNILYILVFIVLASFGVGYSYISTQLNINGTANVTAASWDVHFTNLNVTEGSITAETPANITSATTVEFAATLENPGDFYEFSVDVVNNGTMDAMIDSFSLTPTLTTAQQKYLEYTVTYSDGAPLANNQELKIGTTETLKVRFKYKENSDKTNYPTEDQLFNVLFDVTYTQADDSAVEVNHGTTVYTVSSTTSYIGQTMPSDITQYSSASEAMAAFSNNPFYLKHIIRNGVIDESYVEFVVTQAMANANSGMTAGTYALRGLNTYDENSSSTHYCKAEYYDGGYCINPYYESNKATLLQAFGSANCSSEYDGGYYKSLTCSVSGLDASAYSGGYVDAGDGSWGCGVGNVGAIYCDEAI